MKAQSKQAKHTYQSAHSKSSIPRNQPRARLGADPSWERANFEQFGVAQLTLSSTLSCAASSDKDRNVITLATLSAGESGKGNIYSRWIYTQLRNRNATLKKLERDLEVPHGPLEMSWKSGSKRQIKVREILLLDQ